jgi:hypothetical protein
VARRAGIQGGAELFHQPEVVAVIPDLSDLAIVAEAEDVHAREFRPFSCRREIAPAARVRAGGSPSRGDQVILPKQEIDPPLEIGESISELRRDRRLSSRPGCGLGWTEVVTDVIVGEDLLGEYDVSARPDFLVEALDEPLIRVSVHRVGDPSPIARWADAIRLGQCSGVSPERSGALALTLLRRRRPRYRCSQQRAPSRRAHLATYGFRAS